MKVVLLEIRANTQAECVNKDLAGGMGTKTSVGNSFLAKVFENVKRQNVLLPYLTNAYLVAIFKRANWEVEVIEIKEADELNIKTDLVLVPSSIVDCGHELGVIKKLKKQGFYVGVHGAFATAVSEYFFKDADFVVKGEIEAVAMDIVKNNELPKGIVEGKDIQDLDVLPFPDWSKFPINKYSYSPALNKKPVLTMLSSRGCPYSCSFYCPYSIVVGKVYRARSVSNIVSEIEYLIKNYKVKAIDFRDMIFSLDRDRTIEIVRKIKEKKLDIIWSCETRLDKLDKELIKEMYDAGLRNINVGIESYSEEILKSSKRLPISIKHQEDIISYCHKLGVNIAAFYILGLEDDTKESVLDTINYAKKLNTLVAQFSISTPFPGTGFFEKIKEEERLETTNWEEYNSYNLVYKHKNLSKEELMSLKEKAFVEYYFRPIYLLKHIPKYIFEKFLWPF